MRDLLAFCKILGKGWVSDCNLFCCPQHLFAGEGDCLSFFQMNGFLTELSQPDFRPLDVGDDSYLPVQFLGKLGDPFNPLLPLPVSAVGKVQSRNAHPC